MQRSPDSRGIYAKPEDLEAELAMASKFSAQSGYTCTKLDETNHADFTVTTIDKYGQEELVGFLEVKRRNIRSTQYVDVMVGKPKYDYLKNLGQKYKVPVYFVFVYDDRNLFFDLAAAPNYPIRNAKGRGNCTVARITDYEPSYYITVKDLQPFS